MKASIVVPTYNSVAWLHTAVKSCLSQTFKDIELIIVNDGSTDMTAQYLSWLAKQKDGRIKIVEQPNAGRSAARNHGNAEATGDIILVLDADDLCYPKRVELTVAAMKSGADVVYGSAVVMDSLGRKRKELLAEPWNHDRAVKDLTNRIVHSTVAYTREVAKRFRYSGGEISELGLDDWAMLIEMSFAGLRFKHIPNVLTIYRHLDSSVSRTRDIEKVIKAKEGFLDGLKVAA